MTTDTNLSRRRLLASMPAAAAALAPAAASALYRLPATTGVDPIYAAIEAHRKAWLDFDAAVTAYGEVEFTDDHAAIVAADAHVGITSHAESVAALALIGIVPTTLAGASAVVNYVVGYYRGDLTPSGGRYDVFGDQSIPEFLATIGETLKAAGGAS